MHRGRLVIPSEPLKRERSRAPPLAQPCGGRRCTETSASVPVRDNRTEGAPDVWLNIWGPSPRTPP
eukprot:3190479-Pyramimonas_sp.AAC.1